MKSVADTSVMTVYYVVIELLREAGEKVSAHRAKVIGY